MSDAETVSAAVWNMGRRGILEVNSRLEPVGFVIGHGVILLPAPTVLVEGHVQDGSLHIPDERAVGLGLQVSVRLIDEQAQETAGYARLIDRWDAYHGRRGTARFAVCAVDGGRIGAAVVDGDEIELVNALGNESPLLRKLNADRSLLERAVRRRLGIALFEPLAVGVDHRGIDVRTRTGVLRVAAGEKLNDQTASEFVDGLLKDAIGA